MIEFAPPRYNGLAVVTPFSFESLGTEFAAYVNSPSSSTAWTANLASYFPWFVTETCTVTECFWLNGTAVAGNVSIAVYDSTSDLVPGAKLGGLAAAVAQSGTNAVQTSALTDFVVTPGLRWIAHWASSSSATFFRTAPGQITVNRSFGFMSESVATNLPATAAPVGTTHTAWAVFGIMVSPRTLV